MTLSSELSASQFVTRARAAVVLTLSASLVQGCAFARLKRDLADLQALSMVTGQVAAPLGSDAPVYVVHLTGSSRTQSETLSSAGGLYVFLVAPEKRQRFIAFSDTNKNCRYDVGEPIGESAGVVVLAAREQRSLDRIDLTRQGATDVARLLDACVDIAAAPRLPFVSGDVTTLDNAAFSDEQAAKGMWQPLESARSSSFGLFFLEPYSPAKTPVIFVHGMQGSPRNFTDIIQALGPTEQAWVVSYPSGIRLPIVARVLADSVDDLRRRFRVSRLRVVGHSMGGLVARAAVLELARRGHADGITELVTLATPYGGVASAQSGLESPFSAVPSWTDIAPTSDFLMTLRVTLPASIKFRLFAAIGGRSGFMGGNNDGTVAIPSQMPEWATAGAAQVTAYEAGHVEVLSDASAVSQVVAPLH